jgi:two-component system, sensor histidine kinase
MTSGPVPDSTAEKAKILLVDDRRANLVALAAVLDSPDHELVLVSSGAEALREVEAGDFAVILLDVQMPGMDGFETATRVKSIERARHIPIIFVTAIDHDAKRVTQSYKHGGVDFIQKPFEAEVMRAKVSVFVDLWKAKEQTRLQEMALREAERAALLASEQEARAEAERLTTSLGEADRLQQEFLSTLGQELRTPLNAILGWTRMMRDGSVREAQRGRALETVERNAGVQLDLIEEMLDISRIGSGKLTLELEPVHLLSHVEAAIEAVRPLAVTKKVGLHAALEREVAAVQADAERMRRIIQQLIGNAVKLTPSGGMVTVSLSQVGASVEIAVEDTGAGIDAAVLPTLFDGLESKTAAAPRGDAGLGVGLAITHHLVTLHGGTIRAESAGSGQGSRFTVTLPAIP